MHRLLGITLALATASGAAMAQDAPATDAPTTDKPNILVIFGDDIGRSNVSAYSEGLVGYTTPNIDRIASEGMKFTDYYAENSCTAGRSTFITGQTVKRTGLSKVGVPGAPVGLQDRDITIAQALKPLGYATGQFGKNHLGDRDQFLPTKHGFDEFFGNLYHLDAEEEPERPYWPQDPNDDYVKNFSPRGVIKSSADGKIEDSGPLTSKRMETIDDETSAAAIDFMKRQNDADTPFFVWMNFTHMHAFTHVPEGKEGVSGMPGNTYADGMVIHDSQVGQILDALDSMGISDNTIVVYTTDNGPNYFSWPDAAVSPFRSEKDSNWEGAFRVPAMVRWPGHIKPGTVSNEIFSGLDWFPTLLAAAGDPDIKDELLQGKQVGATTYKLHLDGYDQLPYLTGQADKGARNEFYYFDDDAQLVAVRWGDWKGVFCEQRAGGGLEVWRNPLTCLRLPKVFNLRMDPYERADLYSDQYNDWLFKNTYLMLQASLKGIQFLETFKEWPPSQLPASFTVNEVAAEVDKYIEQLLAKQASDGGAAAAPASGSGN